MFLCNNEVTHSLARLAQHIIVITFFSRALSFGCWLCSFMLIEWVDNPKNTRTHTTTTAVPTVQSYCR